MTHHYHNHCSLLVDASKAGSGNIEIMINDGEIACSVQNHGNYRFTASFVPANMEDHRIEMKFNSEQVPGLLKKKNIFLSHYNEMKKIHLENTEEAKQVDYSALRGKQGSFSWLDLG